MTVNNVKDGFPMLHKVKPLYIHEKHTSLVIREGRVQDFIFSVLNASTQGRPCREFGFVASSVNKDVLRNLRVGVSSSDHQLSILSKRAWLFFRERHQPAKASSLVQTRGGSDPKRGGIIAEKTGRAVEGMLQFSAQGYFEMVFTIHSERPV